PFAHFSAVGFIEVLGNDSGAGNRGLALRYQHRRGGRGIEPHKPLAPLPDPLFHQPQIEAVFPQRKADEARLRTERMMEQREHESLDHFTVIKKPSPPKAAPNYRSTRFRQPAFDIFHVAAG